MTLNVVASNSSLFCLLTSGVLDPTGPSRWSAGSSQFPASTTALREWRRELQNLVPKVTHCHFHCLLLVKMNHKASSDSRGGDIKSPS